jgi:antitoxin ParD1/3/4
LRGNATGLETGRPGTDLDQIEDARIAAWQAAIRVGDEQLDRGEGIAYTPSSLKSITESAISAQRSGQPMDPDALP